MKKAWFFTFSLSLVSVSFCDEVHEWGTFTTVSGSDGTVLPGLHVEEERLPAFVYSHEGVQYHASRYPQYLRESYAVNNSVGPIKGFPQTHRIENVTVKLETPVLYFYGDEKKEYNVKVGFNGGSISQWYPQRTSGDSLPKVPKFLTPEKQLKLDFSSPYEGAIEWDLTSIPKSESDHAFTFKPNQTLTWEYPRVAGANMLKVGEEYEDYLFYRGIGNFEQHVKFSVNQDDTLVIQNLSAEKIPFAFAFENTGNLIRYRVMKNGLAGNDSTEVGLADWKVCNQKTWRRDVFQNVREGLIAQGLTKDESEGMVKTWWNSYFEHDGLRVFWVVPEGELEKVLPIEITPAPEKMVRVIVGRGEVMRPSLEKNLQKQLADGKLRNLSSHRFFEPYVARLRDFVSTPYFAKPTHEFLKYNSVTLSEMLENGKPVRGKTRNLRFIEKDGKLLTQSDKEEWQTISESEVKIGDRHYKFDKENNSYKSEPIGGVYYQIKMPQLLSEA